MPADTLFAKERGFGVEMPYKTHRTPLYLLLLHVVKDPFPINLEAPLS